MNIVEELYVEFVYVFIINDCFFWVYVCGVFVLNCIYVVVLVDFLNFKWYISNFYIIYLKCIKWDIVYKLNVN